MEVPSPLSVTFVSLSHIIRVSSSTIYITFSFPLVPVHLPDTVLLISRTTVQHFLQSHPFTGNWLCPSSSRLLCGLLSWQVRPVHLFSGPPPNGLEDPVPHLSITSTSPPTPPLLRRSTLYFLGHSTVFLRSRGRVTPGLRDFQTRLVTTLNWHPRLTHDPLDHLRRHCYVPSLLCPTSVRPSVPHVQFPRLFKTLFLRTNWNRVTKGE